MDNEHYEQSGIYISKRDLKPTRVYKLATLRGNVNDTGINEEIINEEIRVDSINIHDLKLSEEMLRTSPMLKQGDILIIDRGFI